MSAARLDLAEIMATLREMADARGEIAMTGNTRGILLQAEEAGLVRAVSGKFKMLEPGTLNSVYTIMEPANG